MASPSLARCALGVSEHPLPAESTGEVAGHLLDAGLRGAELVVAAVAPGLAGALEDISASLARLLDARHCVGMCSGNLIGGGRRLGTGGLVALALGGPSWRAARLRADGPAPTAVADGAAIGLVVSPAGVPVPLAPGLLGGCVASTPAPIHLDGEPAPEGAVLWCDAGSGVRTVHLGGWRAVGPARIADGTGARLATLDGLPAAEVVLADLAELTDSTRRDAVDLALRVLDAPAGRPLVALGVGQPPGWLRTSVPVRPGQSVELVVRDAEAWAAELQDELSSRRGCTALVCSPLLGGGEAVGGGAVGGAAAGGEAVADPLPETSRLARRLAVSSGELPVIGVALDVLERPAPVAALVCGG